MGAELCPLTPAWRSSRARDEHEGVNRLPQRLSSRPREWSFALASPSTWPQGDPSWSAILGHPAGSLTQLRAFAWRAGGRRAPFHAFTGDRRMGGARGPPPCYPYVGLHRAHGGYLGRLDSPHQQDCQFVDAGVASIKLGKFP